jgi:hypothetical protein
VLATFAAIVQLGGLVVGVDLAPAATLAGIGNLWPLSVFYGGVTLLVAGFTRRAGAITGTRQPWRC